MSTAYWDTPGAHNTTSTLELAVRRAHQLAIGTIVVASCTGETCRALLGCGLGLVCVTHHVGFAAPGEDEMDAATREYLTAQGVRLLTTTHLFAGVDRALRNRFGGVYPAEIIAQTLRIFGQGVKVAVEISCMAADAGLIPPHQEVVAVAGSAHGADAAVVVAPAHSHAFFDTQVREIICMPRLKS
ncbi:MAG: pyruvate kinase alpha/beta domain-containing protein [Syntrophomonadaceae bacterium]|nr:hypothetical protein [Syntrophomonadaceae bacterium]MDH7498221.1 pyruvate kinase alpha/beta domain-containing protein [Syntrophomonadaceae bacterium]